MRILLFLSLAVAVCGDETLSLSGLQQLFAKTGQSFPSVELRLRLGLVRKAEEQVLKHNAQPDKTFEMELNQFSALTESEKQLYLGANVNESSTPAPFADTPEQLSHPSDLPDAVDHVSLGHVAPVRNQGACGSCWAFGSTGAIEGVYAVTEGRIRNFADQEILDCSYGDDRDGCKGGWMDHGFNYIRRSGRFSYRSDIGYYAKDRACNYGGNRNGINNVVIGANGYASNDDQVARILVKHPISVAYTVENDMFGYKGGIYNGCQESKSINHAVTMVGYTLAYWRYKNSWGTGWGEKGYCRITRARPSVCRIANHGMYPQMTKRGKLYTIKSSEGRFLGQRDHFEDIREKRSDEGGWAGVERYPYALPSNSNNDGLWEIYEYDDGTVHVINYHSGRYLFDVGSDVKGNRGDEGGWTSAPLAKLMDDKYYSRWNWKKVPVSGNTYLLENVSTRRYLFASGSRVYTVDANYYNMAYWTIEEVQ